MTVVFVGGSRAVSRLNSIIRGQIDELIAKRCAFVVGDANGADKAVQQHLSQREYPQVTVFCRGECRNNIGNWTVRVIAPPNRKRDFAFYAAKDRVINMAKEARCGLMLWDGKSRGTLENIHNLLDGQKRVRIYLAGSKEFYTVSSEYELRDLMDRMGLRMAAYRQAALRV
jgi:hypothetical protein